MSSTKCRGGWKRNKRYKFFCVDYILEIVQWNVALKKGGQHWKGLGWCSCPTFVFLWVFFVLSVLCNLASGRTPLQPSWSTPSTVISWMPIHTIFLSRTPLFVFLALYKDIYYICGLAWDLAWFIDCLSFKKLSFRWGLTGLTVPFSSTRCISSIKWCFSAQSSSVHFSVQSHWAHVHASNLLCTKRNSIMERPTSLISSLLDVALSWDVPFC